MESLTTEQIAEAFRKVLSEGEGATENRRAILIKRIPIICNDILTIKGDLRWIKWLVMAICGGIGLLVIAFLTK
jgi:hypothetical protein